MTRVIEVKWELFFVALKRLLRLMRVDPAKTKGKRREEYTGVVYSGDILDAFQSASRSERFNQT